MASTSLSAVLLLSLLSLLATGAVGRPCKTFLISYTVSSGSSLEISTAGVQAPPRFFAFYRVIPPAVLPRSPLLLLLRGRHHPPPPRGDRASRPPPPRGQSPAEPSLGVSSVRERTRDILVVVAGLLFVVGCWVLTSSTMYLAWYLFSNRDEVCGSRGYDYLDDEDMEGDIESPKKRGYTDLPAAPATPVSPLKEGYEGK